MQKLTDLFDQYQHAFKLQAQALRLLDALSDIDNGTNPRITHARRRAFRRWDMRERRATRLYETWFNYRKALSNSRYDLEKSALDRFNEQRLNRSGDTFAASPAGAPENAKPEERSDRTAGAGQGKQPTAGRPGTCTACGQSCDDLGELSGLCPDCAHAYAIQEDLEPAHPSSMYQCPNYRPLSDGRFCACQSCNPVPA